MKIKTSELSGAALDWAVAQIAGRKLDTHQGKIGYYVDNWDANVTSKFVQWSPSTDWSQCGPLIERFRIDIITERESMVAAYANDTEYQPLTSDMYGESVLIAACRAIVAAKLGYDVDVPEGLV